MTIERMSWTYQPDAFQTGDVLEGPACRRPLKYQLSALPPIQVTLRRPTLAATDCLIENRQHDAAYPILAEVEEESGPEVEAAVQQGD